MAFNFKPFHAPKSYSFVDPDTGYKFFEQTFEALISRIVNYRIQNNLEHIDNLAMVLNNYWCALPENAGSCKPIPHIERDYYTTVKGGIALFTAWLFKKFTSKEEADKRAEVCIKCPNNVFPDKGPFIEWSDKIAEKMVGARKSTYHEQLGNCDVCTCCLKAKVFYGGDISLTDEEKERIKKTMPTCWQLKE